MATHAWHAVHHSSCGIHFAHVCFWMYSVRMWNTLAGKISTFAAVAIHEMLPMCWLHSHIHMCKISGSWWCICVGSASSLCMVLRVFTNHWTISYGGGGLVSEPSFDRLWNLHCIFFFYKNTWNLGHCPLHPYYSQSWSIAHHYVSTYNYYVAYLSTVNTNARHKPLNDGPGI